MDQHLQRALWLDKKFSIVGLIRFLIALFITIVVWLGYLLACPEADAYQIFQGPPAGKTSDTQVVVDTLGRPAEITTDLFARIRVANPKTVMDVQNQYDRSPLMFEEWVAGSGVFAALPNQSSVQYSTGGTASGAGAFRQTRNYWRYQPGKMQEVIMSRVIGAAKANVRQRIGMFDSANGLFFEQTSTGLRAVMRSSVTGTPVDTVIEQSAWQDCKADGSGPSRFALDTSKENLYFIGYQWLGSGDVVFGVFNGHQPVVCTTMAFSNTQAGPYMTTPNLPVRGEIENTGAAASATTMIETCTTVISSAGGNEPFGYNFAVDTGVTGASVTTTPRAVISIRPKATFNGIVNRADVDLLTYGVVAVAQNVRCRIMYNVTFTGTPVWVSADANSMVEYSLHNDVSAGAFTGGVQVQTLYGISGQGQSAGSTGTDLDVSYPLALDHNGANPTSISLTCTSFTGTATVNALMNWLEER